jgi:membrane protein
MARPGLSLRERMGAFERRARRFPPVRALMTVNDAYNAVGGGLLASGLAFSALFAVIPGLLLIVSIVVVVVADAAKQKEITDWLIAQVPPLHDVADQIVRNLANSARVGTVLGFVGFLWGASGFYLALENALSRFFPSRRGRDPIMGRVRSMLAVLLVVFGVLAAFGVNVVLSFLARQVGLGDNDALALLSPLIAVAAASLICLACYLLVPVEPPRIRAAAPASLVAGIFIGVLTALFGLIAPELVRGFTALGTIASVFVALIWFGYVFQALLYGAAYARLRDIQERALKGPPTV